MDRALADLIRISNATGKDPALVVGGGGNTSVKTEDGKYMYIKASGTALKDMSAKIGWRRMRIESVLAILDDKSLAGLPEQRRETEVVNRLLLACDDNVKTGARPSVESHLHASLDRCVIHLHPLVVSSFVNARNGRAELEKLFAGESQPPLWVPYADPGFMLARAIARLVRRYEDEHGRKPKALFAAKHGVFVTAPTPEAALRVMRKVLQVCGDRLKPVKPRRTKALAAEVITAAKLAIRKGLFDATGQYGTVSYLGAGDVVSTFMSRTDAPRLLATAALNPDELVYGNGSAVWLKDARAETARRVIAGRLDRGRKVPAAFVVKGLGLFAAGEKRMESLVRDLHEGSLYVRIQAASLGGLVALTKREEQFIDEWESEAFRKQMVSWAGVGALQGRIAVVTGAGSGLGRSIAQGLARAGAMVALADIDADAAAQTALAIVEECPRAETVVVHCDVTSEDSVREAFAGLLETWGGLDILVNAAGVAPAYPLVSMPADKWRVALEVNLTGYFLMARQAARVLIEQGMGGCIVNLSSKSGLDASKDNTAYNATKAGEIHMARGWALELGEHGIRVNSVAPGNVFEGSKIWNPAYIRAAARKYGIKPDEVIPYYVDKTALRREIKGHDIADAVVFLCSDRARTITGQTLVADSGQVMVR